MPRLPLRRAGKELVSYTSKCAYYDDYRLLLSLFLYDSLKAKDALDGTY